MYFNHMKYDKVVEFYSHVKFLDWKFVVKRSDHDYETLSLDIYRTVPDTQDTDRKPIPIISTQLIPLTIGYADLARYTFETIMENIRHEAGEIYKIKDISIFDEHQNRDLNIINQMFTQ